MHLVRRLDALWVPRIATFKNGTLSIPMNVDILKRLVDISIWVLIQSRTRFKTKFLFFLYVYVQIINSILHTNHVMDEGRLRRLLTNKYKSIGVTFRGGCVNSWLLANVTKTDILTTLTRRNALRLFGVISLGREKTVVSKQKWAYPVWYIIHIAALHESSMVEPTLFWSFMDTIPHIIPCVICAEHARLQLQTIPRETYRGHLFTYTSMFHQHSKSQGELSTLERNQLRAMYRTNTKLLLVTLHELLPELQWNSFESNMAMS